MNKQAFSDKENKLMHLMDETAMPGEGAKKAEAFVMENVLVSLVGGMSAKNKEILLDSVQYAISRTGGAPRGVDQYEKFIGALNIAGFLSRSAYSGGYSAKGSRLTMDKVGLDIFASLVSSAVVGPLTGALLLELVGKALNALKAEDKPLEIFEHASKSFNDVNYALLSAVENSEGDVTLALAIVTIRSSASKTSVLFWEFEGSSVEILRGEDIKIFNASQWRRSKDLIEEYLKKETEKAFLEFDL